MLRITAVDRDGLKLEGRLAGAWVAELARAADDGLGRAGALQVDLSAVGFVDAEGARLLRELAARGVEIRNCSRFVFELLERSR